MTWFHSVSELADFCGAFAGAIQERPTMTQDGWKQVIRHANANEHSLDLLSRLLAEQDLAKNRLSSVYGCTGMPWPELVDNIMDASRKDGLVAWLSK